ncbi:glutamate-5-semialdehyde dehydrogenase [Cognataquiflexum rubidum]|uniref:glutamate-5-semialdehyde dehydrogenase n=1 Tax=Cognataquiflexum rubidum TaxID=2922273 RepID=UPI001F139A64|nr:glutamate-5-semialdehyde dehydrogenase [Cognataquiflexum rubidum]MCH6233058.1 glutamate-5-semialdehyde dehydrogenase [Cognataquiflexum rubidum]
MADYNLIFKKVKSASRKLMAVDETAIQNALSSLVRISLAQIPFILAENAKDLALMDTNDPKYDRLKLTEERIKAICEELTQIKNLPSPLDKIIEEKILPNRLSLKKITVPLGVLGVIYEARPNVTFDVFALALKSGNGLILKGGSDADHSNRAIMSLIHRALEENGLPTEAFQLLPPDRGATKALLEAVDFVDVIIPRGSQGLIDFVRQNSKVPVIETGAGIVHTYFDESADLEKGKAIIFNSKTRRPSVCNSLDCLIIHRDRLTDLPELVEKLLSAGVTIFADQASFPWISNHPLVEKAREEHFGTEFLSLKMSIKTVSNLEEAMDHIAQYSSKHSEAIISENPTNIDLFLKSVDAAAVYANASTAFTDGNQFGLGAEIGISTQKLHARGPMALNELCSYKWVIKGDGQIRE